jgi:hypothetical protein
MYQNKTDARKQPPTTVIKEQDAGFKLGQETMIA